MHPQAAEPTPGSIAELARRMEVPLLAPERPDEPGLVQRLRAAEADVFVLAGYGKILPADLLRLPRRMAINQHAGRLPHYRGSSPLNWALINGDTSVRLTIIALAAGVDTGDVLLEREFPIGPADTIRDLHAIAAEQFPQMTLEVLARLESGTLTRRPQEDAGAAYYPLRFPDDGLILWDQFTAGQVHNRIRALTTPCPGAFTFYQGRKLMLLASEPTRVPHYGEPGRVYRVTAGGLLVCASDQCLWVRKAVFADDGEDATGVVQRYARLATVREAAAAWFGGVNVR